MPASARDELRRAPTATPARPAAQRKIGCHDNESSARDGRAVRVRSRRAGRATSASATLQRRRERRRNMTSGRTGGEHGGDERRHVGRRCRRRRVRRRRRHRRALRDGERQQCLRAVERQATSVADRATLALTWYGRIGRMAAASPSSARSERQTESQPLSSSDTVPTSRCVLAPSSWQRPRRRRQRKERAPVRDRSFAARAQTARVTSSAQTLNSRAANAPDCRRPDVDRAPNATAAVAAARSERVKQGAPRRSNLVARGGNVREPLLAYRNQLMHLQTRVR